AAISTSDFDEIAGRVVLALKRVLVCEIVNLRMMDEPGDLLVVHPVNVGAELGWKGRPLRLGQGLVGRSAESGRPLRVDDVRQESNYVVGWADARSELCVPIQIGGRVIGVINAQSSRLAAFNDDDVFLLGIVAGQLAGTLENARLYTAERERTAYLGVLYQMNRRIAATLDPDEVLQAAVLEAVASFPYTVAAILLIDEERGELKMRSVAGLRAADIPPDYRQPISEGIMGYVARTGQTYCSNVVEADPYFVGLRDLQTGAELTVPLKREGRVIGVLNMEKPAGERFSEAEVMAMETLAGQVAAAMENAGLYEELREYVRRIEDSQQQLIQAEKLAALGRLVGSIAHEVNNPLQAIQNCLHLASHNSLSEEKRGAYHQMATEEVERLINTVRQMLDFYQPTGADFVPTDLNRLLDDVLTLASRCLTDNRVAVKKLYRKSLPPVSVARNNIKQVFLNLLLNACEAMPDGGSLTLRTGLKQNGRRRMAAIAFSDTGLGIAADDQAKVFEPFFTTKERGTGLGLAVSYGIVETHGGWIKVKSAPGSGATFTVYLPVERS
ncbi:MAG: GAF domain-containing protein, partial [Chloroflexota bacterium]